ncbi:MAG TPA: Asp-tRNA(Asn)/Glu-tRNA(Gln) amidotransferase subunit GatB [Burkholderiales bacterium]|nr:Asp-tRNA(Asn)/Glu-tRNA(Gln) amidotransferase subunit GatB [Burkholderiales bacterium]
MEWEVVIGLEVHAQLATRSKIFSGAPTAYGAAPNTQACAIDIALPGVLPVMNREAVNFALRFGLAIGANINRKSIFARKNYFYPDLPKGYQISQYELPIVSEGRLIIETPQGEKNIRITRAHLEEDAGKSLHEDFHSKSGIDLNRAGTPLLEIVSEPDIRSSEEAVIYAKTLHSLVRYLEICDGNMQEGSFRCDANVSVRPKGQKEYGTRCEIKNLNSFRFLERAIDYEVHRQIEVIESGGEIIQETKLYDSDRDETRSMRSKEEANDYRYFPDPDLLPLIIDESWIEEVSKKLPELPYAKRQRYIHSLGLTPYDASVLTSSKSLANWFEASLKALGEEMGDAKLCANWIMGEISGRLNRDNLDISKCPVDSKALAQLLRRIKDGTISGNIAKEVFEAMWSGEGEADEIIKRKGLKQISDNNEIEKIIDGILAGNDDQIAQYRAGKERVLGFFVGQVMKATQGRANPAQVNEILRRKMGRPD